MYYVRRTPRLRQLLGGSLDPYLTLRRWGRAVRPTHGPAIGSMPGPALPVETDDGGQPRHADHLSVSVVIAWVNELSLLEPVVEALLRQRPGSPAGLAPTAPEPVRVVGNLPYYITSDILLHLFAHHACLESAVLMVQREVADRIAARPGSRDYGLLSATAQLYAEVEKLFTVPPGAFDPPPKVFSAVLRLTIAPRFASLRVPEKGFIEFLKLCFAQTRKTLFNNLRTRYEPEVVRAALRHAGVRPDVRAEALTLEKTAAVFRRLTS